MSVLYRFPPNDPRSPSSSRTESPGTRRRGRILLIVVLGCFLLGMAFTALPGASQADAPSATASGIKSLVIKTALHRPSDATQPHGGVLGPWWIYATGTDGGDLLGLCLEGSDAHIAASRAAVQVDTEANTLSFHLEDVVIVTLPDKQGEGRVERYESLQLGPVPMSVDIQAEVTEQGDPYS